MTKFALLNNVEHQNLKVMSGHSETLGDGVMYAMTYPAEFRNVQAYYPILFIEDGSADGLLPVALFGFEKGENLFLDSRGWDARYIPKSILRQPFLIGSQGEGDDKTQVVSIDMDSPRLSETVGERLFEPLGGTSAFLDQATNILEQVLLGYDHAKEFVSALQALDLLELINIDIELMDQSKNQLFGFHAIDETKLAALTPQQLGELNEQGFLLAVFMVIASTANMEKLVARKNAQRRAGE